MYGEEFYMLIPDTCFQQAQKIAGNLHMSIDIVTAVGDCRLNFSVSIGIACWPVFP